MIDFTKKIRQTAILKKTNPIEIYDDLDRTSTAGPLRPSQIDVLSEWYEHKKNSKDIIIKLHTGEGKTLIGLLILLSKLNLNEGPCVYVCPNKYLVLQVFNEAKKFGIPVCTIGDNNMLPNEFSDGSRILITHAQKMFNGKTIFGKGNNFEKVGAVILDDAHSCLDSIREAFIVNIKRKKFNSLFNDILNLFEEDLIEQGEGTFLEIKENSDYESMMMIPYWSWIEKKSDTLRLLAPYADELFLTFTWPLIKDSLENCQAYINGKEIQILPIATPIELFGSFSNASNRILMSATTQDDIYFAKTLDFNVDAIKKPIISSSHKWSGEKMVLLPSLIDETLTREKIIEYFCQFNYKFGVVSLVPTWRIQDSYQEYNCTLVSADNIYDEVRKLQDGNFGKTVVLTNRYDGIDLPDNSCRILIIDSIPFFTCMDDRYEEKARINCNLIQKKIAQKIEQGLGRSVRSEKDYCCILILGAELVKFIRSKETRGLFSTQTSQQIEIGLKMATWASEGERKTGEDLMKEFVSLVNQCLKRDNGWKTFYKNEMDEISSQNYTDKDFYNVLLLERKAEKLFLKQKYDEAVNTIQSLMDTIKLDKSDRGWYLQKMARYKFPISRLESNALQKASFENNMQLLKPKEGITYKKISNINISRIHNIINVLKAFDSYDDMMLEVNNICEQISFGTEADKFEAAIERLGELLGFESQRPDKMIRKGPDNLWGIGKDSFIMLECKSEVNECRKEIHKTEVGQMNNHCGWFDNEYGDAKVIRIMIIPTLSVAYDADFTHDVKILRKNKLILLKKNIAAFCMELKEYDLRHIDETFLTHCIYEHNLNTEKLLDGTYYENWKKSK